MDAPAADAKPTCCVCDAPGGKHCTKCKSRHYCSKACQVVDWKEGGHKDKCKQMAKEFQDRLLDELMPEKKPKEDPPIVEDFSPADGAKAVPRLSAVRTGKTAEPSAPSDDAPNWRGTCAICFDLLPFGRGATFYNCCCKTICTGCFVKCRQHDDRCPLCRAPAHKSHDELVRQLQKHVDKGKAEAQVMLGNIYFNGTKGLEQDLKRAVQLFERAAAQGYAPAQFYLGFCYAQGQGVEIDHESSAQWFQRAAEQGFPAAQLYLGNAIYEGTGVAQSYAEAVKWFRLAAAQGEAGALYSLGVCYANGQGVPHDDHEALRCCKRAAAQGHAGAAAAIEKIAAQLARPPR